MPFTLPEDLAPECYPLAWLLGRWRGFGMLGYPGVPEQPFVQEIVFDHDGGPYLRSTSTIWLADTERSGPIAQEMTGNEGAGALVPAEQWSTETSYWRPVPASADDGGDGVHGGGTELEVLVADPAGQMSVYLGTVRGPRVDLATDAVVRTATAAEVAGATRMYGLVQSDLLWAMDLAAFGNELQSYASGRLSRQSSAEGEA
ncbi:FABP family protein [Georgenia sp. TF02-10]|uniref:FABP family protein n=1 Tax=Georgenia sp. TF02-10 TaxID=2917725 RepID=UPI001FA79036|nr:FABP family protein [Georgenia sp. TF02-10]UNX54522.1 FABP family protein [Georgenia sp. TF02-10]